MVTLGVDCHKKSHTIVAVDELGRSLGSRTIPATPAGHLEGLRYVAQWEERCWAVENVRNLSRVFERELLLAGERVLHVTPQLMAGQRTSARERGKSDVIDALNVARVLLREGGDLPVAQLEGRSRELKVIVDYREALIRERTQKINRVLWLVHELDPGFEIKPRSLDVPAQLARLASMVEACEATVVARVARELVEDLRELNQRVKGLDKELDQLTQELVPSLRAVKGCGPVTAATIVGETAGINRFHSRASYAMFNGTAPVPASSGNRTRVRLNRGGNRRINAALHVIALTQIRTRGLGYQYFQHRVQEGDTPVEARRALRRKLSDVVHARLSADQARLGDSTRLNHASPRAA